MSDESSSDESEHYRRKDRDRKRKRRKRHAAEDNATGGSFMVPPAGVFQAFSLVSQPTATEGTPVKYSVIKKDLEKSEHVCYGCDFEFGPTDPIRYPDRAKLWSLYLKNKGTMRDEVLAKQISEAHETHVRAKMIMHGEACPKWPWEVVLAHMNVHMRDPKTLIDNRIEETNVLILRTLDKCFKIDDKGIEVPDHDSIRSYIAAGKHQVMLLNCNVNQMHRT